MAARKPNRAFGSRNRWIVGGVWAVALLAMGGLYRFYGSGSESDDLIPTYSPDDRAPLPERWPEVDDSPANVGRYRGGPRNTARFASIGPSNPVEAWRYRVGSRLTAQPVANDELIFIGAHGHEVHALDWEGHRRWTADAHERVWSAAAVLDTETLLFGSDVDALFAVGIDDGRTRWRARGTGDVDGAPAIAPDGTVRIASGRDLLKIGRGGRVIWRFRASDIFQLATAAVDAEGTAYIGNTDHHLYAVTDDGRMRWSYEAGDRIATSALIADDGTVIFGCDDQHVHAVNRRGERRWSLDVGGIVRAPPALDHRGRVLVGTYGPRPHLVAIDIDSGRQAWRFAVTTSNLRELGIASGPIVDGEDNAYFGTHDNFVYSVSPTGELRWLRDMEDDVDGAPLLLDDGTLLVAGDVGSVYAFRERDESEPADEIDPDIEIDPDPGETEEDGTERPEP